MADGITHVITLRRVFGGKRPPEAQSDDQKCEHIFHKAKERNGRRFFASLVLSIISRV
jgi:hypothetical protein